MTVYLIAFVKPKDPTLMREYSAAAGPTIGPAGGKIVGRGKVKELAGTLAADAALIVSFENLAALEAWYGGSAYQALIPLRDKAMDATFVSIDVPA